MKTKRIPAAWLSGSIAALLLASCSRLFDYAGPPPDRAVVFDHYSEAVGTPDYTLRDIDGAPVERERFQFGVDMSPGAIMRPGKHTFKVAELPARRLPGAVPVVRTFTGVVEGGKTYSIRTRQEEPVLIEDPKLKSPQK